MTTPNQSLSHPHAALPEKGDGSLISSHRLIEIYAAMLRCRILRERLRSLPGAAKLRSLAPGSEAVAASSMIGLLSDDLVSSRQPHLFAALLRSVPLASLVQPLVKLPSRGLAGINRQVFSACGVLDTSLTGVALGNFAAGTAFANKLGGRGQVTVVFLDDNETEKSWGNVFALALANSLPIIFIRQAAVALPQSVRSGRGKAKTRPAKVFPQKLPVIPVDCRDAVAVYRVAHEAIAHARRGSGPTLIDCVPLRLAGERRQDSDCIARMERYLEAKQLRPERIKNTVVRKFTRALDAAVAAAGTRRKPPGK